LSRTYPSLRRVCYTYAVFIMQYLRLDSKREQIHVFIQVCFYIRTRTTSMLYLSLLLTFLFVNLFKYCVTSHVLYMLQERFLIRCIHFSKVNVLCKYHNICLTHTVVFEYSKVYYL